MKRIIAIIGAYSLFWLGDKLMYVIDKFSFFECYTSFKLYQYLMCWSSDIQDWGGLDKPWNYVNKKEDKD